MAAHAEPGNTELHRYSLAEYHQLIESGGFDEDTRVELLDGWLVDMSPKTPRHERAIAWLSRWLFRALDDERYELRVASPLTIGRSEPEPDLTVIARDTPAPYHPARAELVIEVAVTSLARDLGRKQLVYAEAGLPEYWVLDIDGQRLIAHRQPTADGYAVQTEIGAGDVVICQALALPPLPLAELLAAASR